MAPRIDHRHPSGGSRDSLRALEPAERDVAPRPWLYLVSLTLPLSVALGATAGGLFSLSTALYAMFGLSLLDLVVGESDRNPPWDTLVRLRADGRYRLVLYAYAIVHLTVAASLLAWAAGVGFGELMAVALSLGAAGSVSGFPAAHELLHERRTLDRLLGRLMLLSLCYLHMHIEHTNHHVFFGTACDASTARLNESSYRFVARTLVGKVRVAWAVEGRRLERAGRSAWSAWNEMGWALAAPPVIVLALAVMTGAEAVALFLGQAAVAIFLFEVAAYFEHYAVERRQIAPGRYERPGPQHSWDTYQRASDYMLFRVQRHADHHAKPAAPYQTLRSRSDSLKLPTGYPGTALLALVPWLWFRVMHPRMRRPEGQRRSIVP